jgi:drug/metabolite transporter (DMT)-like permease
MKEKYDNEYWFPAKRYGWGWGPPRRWQGWLVLAGYFAVIILATFLRTPDRHPLAFFAVTIVSTAIFIAICYAKGEPPRWRWGGDDLK